MSEYVRTTRECSVHQLHPELLRAIQAYFQEHKLGNLEAETQTCCETISKKKNVSKTLAWLSGKPDTIIYTGMLLTAQLLIWGHYGDASGTVLNVANLSDIRVAFDPPLFTKDAGLQIVGYLRDAKARVHGSIALGTDWAAQKFCEEVQQAINKVNPPTKKGLFGWRAG